MKRGARHRLTLGALSLKARLVCRRLLLILSIGCLISSCSFLQTTDSQPAEGHEFDEPPAAPEPAAPSAAEPEQTTGSEPWYNSSMFHGIFGDFDPAAPIQLNDKRAFTALQDRGKYLATGPAICGSCHGADPTKPDSPLSGGAYMQDRFGKLPAANITPDKKTGIGTWGMGDVVRAIRSSIDKDGRPLSVDLHSTYRWLSDTDVKAIAVYLLTSKPVENSIERRRLGAFERKKWGLINQYHEVQGYVTSPPRGKSSAYGRYLAYNVSGCYGCHTPESGIVESATPFAGAKNNTHSLLGSFEALFSLLSPEASEDQKAKEEKTMRNLLSAEGQEEFYGEAPAQKIIPVPQSAPPRSAGYDSKYDAAIESGSYPISGPDIRGTSETGLIAWSKDQLTSYMSNGTKPDGKVVDGRVCPWPLYGRLAAQDKEALAIFLKQQ